MRWESVPVGYLTKIVAGQSPPSDDVTTVRGDGLPFVQGNAEFQDRFPAPRYSCDVAPKVAPAGSLLLSVRAPVGELNEARDVLGIGRGLVALKPDPDLLENHFAWWAILAKRHELRAVATGSTYPAVTATDVAAWRLPVPALDMQRRIADYLDTEIARIDTLIAKNMHAMALIEERHYAYLEHSIWRPEFPRRKLAAVCDPSRPVRYGIVLPGPSVDDGVPLIKGGDVHRQTLEQGTDARVDRDLEAGYVRSRVCPGDLVYTIRGSYGDVAVVPDNLPVANLTQDVARIAPKQVETDWLRFALDAPSARSYANVVATGATIKGVNIGDLRHMPVPVPEPSERGRTLRETRRVLALLAQTKEALSEQHELLLERRQSLITAVVTGEFEI